MGNTFVELSNEKLESNKIWVGSHKFINIEYATFSLGGDNAEKIFIELILYNEMDEILKINPINIDFRNRNRIDIEKHNIKNEIVNDSTHFTLKCSKEKYDFIFAMNVRYKFSDI